jgi:hypothetical protein
MQFLHRHRIQEAVLNNTDHEHVIVDKADWENALKLLSAAGTQRDVLFNVGKNAELVTQDFSDAIKRCNQNIHR